MGLGFAANGTTRQTAKKKAWKKPSAAAGARELVYGIAAPMLSSECSVRASSPSSAPGLGLGFGLGLGLGSGVGIWFGLGFGLVVAEQLARKAADAHGEGVYARAAQCREGARAEQKHHR